MTSAEDLIATLTLEPLGNQRFRSSRNETNPYGRVYGGQPMAQALAAALHTVPPDRMPTSLQQVFLSGARPEQPIDYSVTTLQDGKRVSSREVSAEQAGRGVTRAFVSAQVPERMRHAMELPAAAAGGPERAVRPRDLSEAMQARVGPSHFMELDPHPNIDYLLVDPEASLTQGRPGRIYYWVRIRHELPPGRHLHAVGVAYLSDWWLPLASIAPHLGDEPAGFYLASLNHTVWFHAECRADDWILIEADSPWASHSRGLNCSRMFTRDGILVASVAQDCLQISQQP